MEDEVDLDEILEEMGYYDEDDDEIEELRNVKVSRGYEEGRKLVDKLRRKLFRTLNDEELAKLVDTFNENVELKEVTTIAFPSRVMMTRLMRACMNCKDVEDLWSDISNSLDML